MTIWSSRALPDIAVSLSVLMAGLACAAAKRQFRLGERVRSCRHIPSHLSIEMFEKEWRWSGAHDRCTAADWLANFDAHTDEIETVLRIAGGSDTALWMRRLVLVLPRHIRPVRPPVAAKWAASHHWLKAT